MKKEIDGYNGYYHIDELGNVYSINCILKKQLINGYEVVFLAKNGVKTKKRVHKLVANAFIPNPENKPCIDHIDGNRSNNNVTNLRWCTIKENNNFPNFNRNKIKIGAYVNGVLIKTYESYKELESNGFKRKPISLCCRGLKQSYKNIIWKYENN